MNERIRSQRNLVGLTQADLAKKVNVSKGSISQWESGITTPSGKNLYSLAEALGVTAQWLLTGQGGGYKNSEEAALYGNAGFYDNETPPSNEEFNIPLYDEIELSAGDGATCVGEVSSQQLRIPKWAFIQSGVASHNAVACYVRGDSMTPVLPSGSVVAIDIASKRVVDGQMYAIDYDGLLRVKYLQKLPGSGILIKSANPVYSDERVYDLEHSNLRIIGRVFWIGAVFPVM